jgi:AAA15 family ATPase/GTPase
MIKNLEIKNFKSIKHLEMECKRINLFIGEPNAGKSNILEALGLASWYKYGDASLKEYVRFQDTQNLFYDDLLDQPVEITIDKLNIEIEFKDDEFYFGSALLKNSEKSDKRTLAILDYSGNIRSSSSLHEVEFIKFYRFVGQNKFPESGSSFLLPPHGSNLFAVVMANKKFREAMARFFKNFGFKLVLKPQERTFEIQKQVDDIVFSYPYILTSDTLQRIIFYMIAMESNKNSTLVFEEPESHSFPYYTKHLGERIAFDETNQYFIATHNPYLLLSILEKAHKNSVNVFITYFREYQTKVKCLTDEQMSELMDYDPFFNLDSFIFEEENR